MYSSFTRIPVLTLCKNKGVAFYLFCECKPRSCMKLLDLTFCAFYGFKKFFYQKKIFNMII